MREIARQAEAAGAVVLLIEADRDLRLAKVVRDELTSALARSAPFSTRLRKALERIVENLPKLAYELPHDAEAYRSVELARMMMDNTTAWKRSS